MGTLMEVIIASRDAGAERTRAASDFRYVTEIRGDASTRCPGVEEVSTVWDSALPPVHDSRRNTAAHRSGDRALHPFPAVRHPSWESADPLMRQSLSHSADGRRASGCRSPVAAPVE